MPGLLNILYYQSYNKHSEFQTWWTFFIPGPHMYLDFRIGKGLMNQLGTYL